MSGYWPSLQTVSESSLLEVMGCRVTLVLFSFETWLQVVGKSGGRLPNGQPGLK
jgi:hypothetical protein